MFQRSLIAAAALIFLGGVAMAQSAPTAPSVERGFTVAPPVELTQQSTCTGESYHATTPTHVTVSPTQAMVATIREAEGRICSVEEDQKLRLGCRMSFTRAILAAQRVEWILTNRMTIACGDVTMMDATLHDMAMRLAREAGYELEAALKWLETTAAK